MAGKKPRPTKMDRVYNWAQRVTDDIIELEKYMASLPPCLFHDKGEELPRFQAGKKNRPVRDPRH